MKSNCTFVTSGCCLLFCCLPFAVTAAEETVSPPAKVIVQAKSTPVMIGSEKQGAAPQGALLEYSRINGSWRFCDKLKGWVHERDLVELPNAIPLFSQRVKERPSAENLHLRGIAYMAAEDWSKALADLERAYDQGENSVSLHFNLGTCYRQLNDLPAALTQFTTILKYHPDEIGAIVARGAILAQQGHWDAALKDYDAAIKLFPDDPAVRNARGIAFRMLNRFAEAEAEYTKALELQPEFAEASANRAYVRKQLKQYQSAREDYERALEVDDSKVSVKNDYAWFLATCPDKELRKPQQAVDLATEVCGATQYENGDYLDTLAAAHAATGDFKQAIELTNKALTVLKTQPQAKDVYERLQLYQKKTPYLEK